MSSFKSKLVKFSACTASQPGTEEKKPYWTLREKAAEWTDAIDHRNKKSKEAFV